MKLRPLINKPVNGSAFNHLVAERIKLQKEYAAADTTQAFKLTPAAFAREARRIAWPRLKDAEALRETVKLRVQFERTIDTHAVAEIQAMLRDLVRAYQSVNFPGPITDQRRFTFVRRDAAFVELNGMVASEFHLSAVAALIATEKYPQSFGDCIDQRAHEQRLLDMRERIEELDAQIAKDWTASDLTFDATGMAFFALGKGQVPLAPVDNAGERLCNWLVRQEPASS